MSPESTTCGWRMLTRSVNGDGYCECFLEPGHAGRHAPGRDVVYVDDPQELEARIRERNGKGPFDD